VSEALLRVEDLVVDYRSKGRRPVRAVDRVSLAIPRGQTVGLVGESGSGKSTIAAAVLGLVAPTGGRVLLEGEPMDRRSRAARAELARQVQAVFQDPFGSMNPTRKVGHTLGELLRHNLRLPPDQIEARLAQALAEVGMGPEAVDRFPSQFSGGQLQRLAIARAMVVQPKLLICDEAVSSLDLSVQAQVINLLASVTAARGLSNLFISHDLSVVTYLSDRIVVLFAGQVMEEGPAGLVSASPRHPYTQSLALAAPVPDVAKQAARRRQRLAGRAAPAGLGPADSGMVVPAAPGCAYAPRCPVAIGRCLRERPALVSFAATGAAVACHVAAPGSEEGPTP
jgi:peptide/nickel transport system ATP-binding protein